MPQPTDTNTGQVAPVTFLDHDMVIIELKVPRETETTPEASAQFFANVSNIIKRSVFHKLMGHKPANIAVEIACLDQTIHFYLICPRSVQSYLESQLKAQYATITILPSNDYLGELWTTPGGFAAGQLSLGHYPMYPIKTYKDFADVDPLVAVLSVMSRIHPNEALVVQYSLGPRANTLRKAGYKYIRDKKEDNPNSTDEMAATQIKNKLSEVTLKAGIRLFSHAETKDRANELMNQLSGSFGGFANGDGNYLKFAKPSSLHRKAFLLSIPTRKYKFVPRMQLFSVTELASLWHMPNTKFVSVPSISWSRTYLTESPENLPTARSANKDQINFFARTDYKGETITFGIKRNDRRRHIYIVGKSGTGKSTLIANMAINDIRNREGMAIIDPHGDLIEAIMDYIPSYRVNDIVYLDPANRERTFALNPLEVTNQSQKELVVSSTVAILAKIFGDSWGPRLEYILRNTLFALADIPGSTFIDVIDMLTNKKFRQAAVAKIQDPVVRNFFAVEFESYSEKMQAEMVSSILNKVGQFVQSPTIRNIIGQPKSTINLEELMNSGKIVLVNLSQGRLGEDNAALLGAMIITKFQLASMNRVNIPEDERKDFFLYVDEFQNFATDSFKKILSEARKYRLDLVMANQYTAQVPEEVLAAIYGNCGTIISFLVGADDASKLTKEFGGVYTDADITNLSNYQILLKLMIDAQASRAFAATTLPLPRSVTQNREKVIRVSQQKYTKPIEAFQMSELSKEVSETQLKPQSDQRPSARFDGSNRPPHDDNRSGPRNDQRTDQRPQPRSDANQPAQHSEQRQQEQSQRDQQGNHRPVGQGSQRFDRNQNRKPHHNPNHH